MIRFIDLGKQISDAPEFAWWDTITDTFLSYGESYTWESWEAFVADFRPGPMRPIARFQSLFPTDWSTK